MHDTSYLIGLTYLHTSGIWVKFMFRSSNPYLILKKLGQSGRHEYDPYPTTSIPYPKIRIGYGYSLLGNLGRVSFAKLAVMARFNE